MSNLLEELQETQDDLLRDPDLHRELLRLVSSDVIQFLAKEVGLLDDPNKCIQEMEREELLSVLIRCVVEARQVRQLFNYLFIYYFDKMMVGHRQLMMVGHRQLSEDLWRLLTTLNFTEPDEITQTAFIKVLSQILRASTNELLSKLVDEFNLNRFVQINCIVRIFHEIRGGPEFLMQHLPHSIRFVDEGDFRIFDSVENNQWLSNEFNIRIRGFVAGSEEKNRLQTKVWLAVRTGDDRLFRGELSPIAVQGRDDLDAAIRDHSDPSTLTTWFQTEEFGEQSEKDQLEIAYVIDPEITMSGSTQKGSHTHTIINKSDPKRAAPIAVTPSSFQINLKVSIPKTQRFQTFQVGANPPPSFIVDRSATTTFEVTISNRESDFRSTKYALGGTVSVAVDLGITANSTTTTTIT